MTFKQGFLVKSTTFLSTYKPELCILSIATFRRCETATLHSFLRRPSIFI